MISLRKTPFTALGFVALLSFLRPLYGEDLNNLLQVIADSPGTEAGLCVHVGSTDGALEIELAGNGRRLVHGLALDGKSADMACGEIRAAGLWPLASVEKARTFDRLPYADNLVGLLIADLDALGKKAPLREEMMRVIRPNGIAFLKTDGKWVSVVKPRPREMDEWTHFDYGPTGNAVSGDKLVRPPKQIQWTCGVQPIKLGGNPAGFVGSPGMRLAGGRAISEWVVENKDWRKTKNYLGAWDAFSGIPLWAIEKEYSGIRRPTHLVAVGERIYTYLENDGPLTALDAATGRIVRKYEQAGALPDNTGMAFFRVCADGLVVVNKDTLYLLNELTGEVIWKYTDYSNARVLMFPTIARQINRVFVLASGIEDDYKIEHRWPNAPAAAVVCLDLKTGKPIWRNTQVAGKHIGQLIANDGYLGLFGAGGIGAGKNPFTGCIRLSDGKLLWTGTFPTDWNRAGYVMLWRDGLMYYSDPWKIFTLDPQTGKETVVYGAGYNGRCTRFCATEDYFIYSLVTYVDREFNGTIQSITRSACANSSFPANGMLYFTPTACGCTTMLRGHTALTPEPLLEPIDDAIRLQTSADDKQTTTPKPFSLPDSPIAADWPRQARAAEMQTEPVSAEGRTFTALIHEHQMHCRDARGKPLWSFTANGRISSPPVVVENLCLFGSHDGWVYALRVADGSQAWRFMAAPYQRKVIVNSQLESAWPVYGVVMHKGLLCTSAGLHPELGGGIYIYGLKPKTGKIAWKRILSKPPAVIAGTERIESHIVPISALNDVLQTDGKQLSLPAGRARRFTFDPSMTDNELRQKLQTNPPKKH